MWRWPVEFFRLVRRSRKPARLIEYPFANEQAKAKRDPDSKMFLRESKIMQAPISDHAEDF